MCENCNCFFLNRKCNRHWCVYFCQESPGGDDLRASAAKVLFGVSGRQARGPKCQTGGAPGEDESTGADQEDPAAGTGE